MRMRLQSAKPLDAELSCLGHPDGPFFDLNLGHLHSMALALKCSLEFEERDARVIKDSSQ